MIQAVPPLWLRGPVETDGRATFAELGVVGDVISAEREACDYQRLANEQEQRAILAEKARDCYRAARLTWPEHVQAAVARGDVEACRADAMQRHANWERLHAELAGARAEAAALRRERDGARAVFEVAEAGLEMAVGACVSRDLVQQAHELLERLGDDRRGPSVRARALLAEALGHEPRRETR